MFGKTATQTLVKTRKQQIFARVIELLEKNAISSREDLVNTGLCTDRYLQDHPELLAYLRTTTVKLVEAKFAIKLNLGDLNEKGYFNTKSISKQMLYAQRKQRVLEILRHDKAPTIKGVARQIPCTPSYLRNSGLSSLFVKA